MEGLRRDDLIRHDKYISFAQARGAVLAKDYHVLYPIPQSAIFENENIKQNPGYVF
jgi:starch-binding outer membrane protein, SusD/RagB family